MKTEKITSTILKFAAAIFLAAASPNLHAAPLKVGDAAPDFTLNTLDGKPVALKKLTAEKPVVLVVLRGWPGYQCPLCTRQVNELVKHADDFAKLNANVLMVYPGPAENLKAHAKEFLGDRNWPKNFSFVMDPDYTFTKSYDLRWDAKGETAYPSTFVIDKTGKICLAHVSKVHGDRINAAAALDALHALK